MKYLVFFLIIFTAPFPAVAQTQLNPTLTLEKTVFKQGEPVTVNYQGTPTKLEAEIRSGSGNAVPFQAVLVDHVLTITPSQQWQPNTYHIRFSNNAITILDQWITIGSPPVSVSRSQTTFIEEGRAQAVRIDISGSVPESSESALVDFVPFDAIIPDTVATQIKLPEYVHPRYPFSGMYEVTLPFGQVNPDEHLGMPHHDGVDFAVPSGTPIIAVDDGEVVPYREVNDYGITVALQHSWGQTFYGHLSTTSAHIGDRVLKGQVIGNSGNTGRSTGAHLHFGMKWSNDQMIDPAPYLRQENETKIAEKKLVFPLSKDDRTITYTQLLPATNPSLRAIRLSAAYIEGDHHLRIATEPSSRTYLIGPEMFSSVMRNDAHISTGTIFTQQDGVAIWKNDGEQSIHTYDLQSDTYSIQSLTDAPVHEFTIGDHQYQLIVEKNSLLLK